MSEFDTTAMLEQIRNRGGLPANDARYSASELLQVATTELRDYLFPMLVNARAEHGIYPYSTAVTAGTATYRMPHRSMGGALRDVVWMPAGGTPVYLPAKSSSDPLVVAEAARTGPPLAYFVRNYQVVLVPTPHAAGTLSMPYYARPNRLIPTTQCAVVETVAEASTNYLITVSGTPPVALQDAVPVDVVRGTPGFETLVAATIPSYDNPSPGVHTYEIAQSLLPEAPVQGDYLCLAGEAPVPQVPVEMHGLLIVRVALAAVEGTGDTGPTAAGLRRQAAELELRCRQWLSPRVESAPLPGGSLSSNPILGAARGWR